MVRLVVLSSPFTFAILYQGRDCAHATVAECLPKSPRTRDLNYGSFLIASSSVTPTEEWGLEVGSIQDNHCEHNDVLRVHPKTVELLVSVREDDKRRTIWCLL